MAPTISSEIVTELECSRIISKRLMREEIIEFRILTWNVTPLSVIGGFTGQYFALNVTVSLENGSSRKFKFFLKCPPPTDTVYGTFVRENGNFDKEVYIYNNIFPRLLVNFDRFIVPECYLAILDRVIVLDDLMDEDFVMLDKMIPVEMHHCRLVLSALAKFHAKSIIFEEKSKKNLQNQFAYCLNEILYHREGKRGMQMFWTGVRCLYNLIDLAEEFDTAAKIKFKRKIEEVAENHVDSLIPSDRFKNVLCHGDLWMNNIMFRIGLDQDRPTHCSLVDFQQMRYTPPALDIAFFLLSSTTRKFRDQYSMDLYKFYHETLSRCLIEADLKPESIFPFEELLESIKYYRRSSLFHTLLHMPVMQLSAEFMANEYCRVSDDDFCENFAFKDRTSMTGRQFIEIHQYRERLMDGLMEFYDEFVA